MVILESGAAVAAAGMAPGSSARHKDHKDLRWYRAMTRVTTKMEAFGISRFQVWRSHQSSPILDDRCELFSQVLLPRCPLQHQCTFLSSFHQAASNWQVYGYNRDNFMEDREQRAICMLLPDKLLSKAMDSLWRAITCGHNMAAPGMKKEFHERKYRVIQGQLWRQVQHGHRWMAWHRLTVTLYSEKNIPSC